jgi:hypothetical protein
VAIPAGPGNGGGRGSFHSKPGRSRPRAEWHTWPRLPRRRFAAPRNDDRVLAAPLTSASLRAPAGAKQSPRPRNPRCSRECDTGDCHGGQRPPRNDNLRRTCPAAADAMPGRGVSFRGPHHDPPAGPRSGAQGRSEAEWEGRGNLLARGTPGAAGIAIREIATAGSARLAMTADGKAPDAAGTRDCPPRRNRG